MKRYEAKQEDDGVLIYDTKTWEVVTVFQAIDLLNAHDGMMTREEVEKKYDEYKNGMEQYHVGACDALETVLNGND